MSDGQESRGPRPVEDFSEFCRGMTDLGRVQAHGTNAALVSQRLLQSCHRVARTEVAQEAHDQFKSYTEARFAILQRAVYPVHGCVEFNASFGMRLRIEKYFDVPDVVSGSAFEIFVSQVMEVLLRDQDLRAGVIDVEEGLQVGELVCGANLIDTAIRNLYAVPLRELHHQLGLERAFDVQMKFGLGNLADECCRFHISTIYA